MEPETCASRLDSLAARLGVPPLPEEWRKVGRKKPYRSPVRGPTTTAPPGAGSRVGRNTGELPKGSQRKDGARPKTRPPKSAVTRVRNPSGPAQKRGPVPVGGAPPNTNQTLLRIPLLSSLQTLAATAEAQLAIDDGQPCQYVHGDTCAGNIPTAWMAADGLRCPETSCQGLDLSKTQWESSRPLEQGSQHCPAQLRLPCLSAGV